MKKKVKQPKKEKLEGIGGWLILPTVGLFLSAGLWLFIFVMTGLLLLLSEEFRIYELTFLLMSPIMAFFAIYSLILEFKKKKQFIKWVIATLWAGVISTIILSILDGDYLDVFLTIISVIIWTQYFNVSIRVKNTFVK